MAKPRPDMFSLSPHLNEAQIVAYLDGELLRDERESAVTHLASCWTCRSLLNEVQASIDAFLEVRAGVLPQESTFPEYRLEQFRQRLARHAKAADARSVPVREQLAVLWTQTERALAFLVRPRQAAIAGFLVVSLVIVMFTDVVNTRVSADTLLSRADQYQATHVPAHGQVSRTSVRVERIDSGRNNPSVRNVKQLGTVMVVRDSDLPELFVQAQASSGKSDHAVVRAGDEMNKDLLNVLLAPEDAAFGQYVAAQHWVPDLSAAEFRRLGASWGVSETSARKHDGAYDVSYRFAPNASGIGEALLEIDVQDFAPTGMSFVASEKDKDEQREYRFTRTAFTVEERTPEIAELFAPMAATSGTISETTTAEPRKLPELSKPVPLSYSQTHATAEEVAITAALHKSDACLGEEIYVFPMSDRTLLVQGIVDSVTRREAIARSLKPVASNVRVEIYLPREIKSGSDLFNPPEQFTGKIRVPVGGEQDTTLADLSNGQAPLYERLNQHFSQPGVSREDADKQVAVFSNEVVTIARQTFLHAWALKRLDAEFSAARSADLSAVQLQEIEQMRQDHRRWIATLAKRESELITPITGSPNLANAGTAAGPVDTDTLLALAQTQNELVRALFADSRQAAHADANLARLLSVVRRMGS